MKKYRLKIDYYYATVYYSKNDIFEFSGDSYYCKRLARWFSKKFVENNPDIFEEVEEEPEPQEEVEEVIEGYASKDYHCGYTLFKQWTTQNCKTPALLILNPKPKKKQEEYTFIVHNEIIKKFRQSFYLSKAGEYSDYINCTLIRNIKESVSHTKIKIIVEE